jgi:hypothetical protein
VSKRWLVSVAIAFLVATFAACASDDPKEDATVTSCVPGTDTEKPRAAGEVRNTSSKTSSFFIRIEFHDPGGNRVSEGVDTITDVEPGTASPFNITGLAHAKGPLTCEVGTVRRTAASTG